MKVFSYKSAGGFDNHFLLLSGFFG